MDTETFARTMQLLDCAALDIACLRYAPSLLALTALRLTVPDCYPVLKRMALHPDETVRNCSAFLAAYNELPFRPLAPAQTYYAFKVCMHTPRSVS